MKGSHAFKIGNVRVSSLFKQERNEIVRFFIKRAQSKHNKCAALVILAIYIYIRLLQESLDAAVMIFQHGNIDGRYFPRVLAVDISSSLKQELHYI